jgi:plasmid stabilization system protein ParE
MSITYKLIWSERSIRELADTLDYLKTDFSYATVNNFSISLEKFIERILENPFMYPTYDEPDIRKAVLLRYNTVFYTVNNIIEILAFFSNRQDPDKALNK